MLEVNYLAVAVAAVVSSVIGAVWYSPVVFGKTWMKLSGIAKPSAKEKKAAGKMLAVQLLRALVMAYVLAYFFGVFGVFNLASALQFAFWAWLGFIATVSLGGVLWEKRPFSLYLLNNAHSLVSLIVMAAILVSWR